MVYKVEISPRAKQISRECVDYLLYYVGGYGNPYAASRFVEDFDEIIERISRNATSYTYCEEPVLRQMHIRKAHFSHLKYKVFFHVTDDTATIDLICHDLQNYENLI